MKKDKETEAARTAFAAVIAAERSAKKKRKQPKVRRRIRRATKDAVDAGVKTIRAMRERIRELEALAFEQHKVICQTASPGSQDPRETARKFLQWPLDENSSFYRRPVQTGEAGE